MNQPKHILIVEDEWLLASELARRLRGAGFAIIGPVPTVAQALDLIVQSEPDGAVLDVQLGRETTFPLAGRLAERSIPFVFLTGHLTGDYPDLLRQHKVLPKPADWPTLVRTLNEMIGI